MASDVAFQYMVAGLALSIMANIGIIVLVWFSGIGKPIVRRIKQRWLYKNGKYVNVIFVNNNHVGKEMFISKEEDGSFKINDQRYAINPMCTFVYEGIPTQITKEGTVEPYDLFNDEMADKMSTAEIESIIMKAILNNLAEVLKKYWPLFLILVVTVVALAAGSLYFNWKIYDYLVQNEYINQAIAIAKQTAEVAPR